MIRHCLKNLKDLKIYIYFKLWCSLFYIPLFSFILLSEKWEYVFNHFSKTVYFCWNFKLMMIVFTFSLFLN